MSHVARRRVALGLMLAMTVFLAASMITLGFAAGTVLYVDRSSASCRDSGSGTATQPFCTIGAAAGKVTAGQTVQVAAGTYPESVTVRTSGTSSAPIVFTAAPAAVVTLSGQANGFVVSSRNWVTVNGFSVTKTVGWGIDVSDSSHITISNSRVSAAGQRTKGKTEGGIRLSGVTDSIVAGNTTNDNSDYGILLTDNSTRNEVRVNVVFNNAEGWQRAAAGIRLYRSPANTIHSNITHHNEDSGIESYTGSNNTLLFNNVAYNNGDHGIDNYHSTGQRVIANTVYKNVTSGINVEGSSTGATLANNISVDNGINSPRTHSNIRIESGSTSGTTMDYDHVYLSVPDAMLIWNSTSYTSLAAFQAASHQEAHGLQASPRWANPTAADFRLTAGSPAIDSASVAVNGQPATDAEGRPRIDDPATPNTGAGSPPYADRGAYEFQSGPAPPVAALSVSPTSGLVDLLVTADASASIGAATYAFDFGDGSAPVGPQAAPTATHTYTAAGIFTVTVTVRDAAGLADTATRVVTATTPGRGVPPQAALTVTPGAGAAPLAVRADASASSDDDGPIASYRFDFGDGTAPVGPQAGALADHTYTTAGTYTATVTITDADGLTAQAAAEVTVTVTVTANLVGNPGFEVNTTGWNTSSSSSPSIVLTRVAGGHTGGWAARVQNTGSTSSTCVLNDSPNWITTAVAGTYTATLWTRADMAGATLKLRIREYRSDTLVGSATTLQTVSTTWQPVTVSYVPAAAGASTLDLNAYVSSAPPGSCFYADDASVILG